MFYFLICFRIIYNTGLGCFRKELFLCAYHQMGVFLNGASIGYQAAFLSPHFWLRYSSSGREGADALRFIISLMALLVLIPRPHFSSRLFFILPMCCASFNFFLPPVIVPYQAADLQVCIVTHKVWSSVWMHLPFYLGSLPVTASKPHPVQGLCRGLCYEISPSCIWKIGSAYNMNENNVALEEWIRSGSCSIEADY